MALRVGAARLTKMRGVVDLANPGSSALGNLEAQTLEYKGFDEQKARELLCGRQEEGASQNYSCVQVVLKHHIIGNRPLLAGRDPR
jgi:hypothetical protein